MKKQLSGLLAIALAGAMCLGFAACGETTGGAGNGSAGDGAQTEQGGNQQGGEQPPELTADTDFSALVSDKVTAAQWDAAFSNEAFAGCSVRVQYADETIYTMSFGYKAFNGGYDISWETTYPGADGEPETENNIWHITQTQYTQYMNYDLVDGTIADGYYFKTQEIPAGAAQNEDWIWQSSFRLYVSFDFAGQFDKFSYDETRGAYVYAGETLTTPYHPQAPDDYTVLSAAVKFSGGKVAYISALTDDDSREVGEYFYYNYGKTQVVIPENAQPVPEE